MKRPCPVCQAPVDVACRALDFGPLPGGHDERNPAPVVDEPTPLYDAVRSAQ